MAKDAIFNSELRGRWNETKESVLKEVEEDAKRHI